MDRVTVTLEAASLMAAIASLGPTADRACRAAARQTAERIKVEAKRRVRRRSGNTAAGIYMDDDYKKTGYVVLTADARADAGQKQANGKRAPRYHKELHVGTYLEYGTDKMSAKPFFYESARLEENAFNRRLSEQLQYALDQSGLT